MSLKQIYDEYDLDNSLLAMTMRINGYEGFIFFSHEEDEEGSLLNPTNIFIDGSVGVYDENMDENIFIISDDFDNIDVMSYNGTILKLKSSEMATSGFKVIKIGNVPLHSDKKDPQLTKINDTI